MPDHLVLTPSASASYSFAPPAGSPGHTGGAFKPEAVCQRPARASSDCSRRARPASSIIETPPFRLSAGRASGTVLRHAPLRPGRKAHDDAPTSSPSSDSLASSGYHGSTGSISLAPSIASVSSSVFTSNDSLSTFPRPSSQFRASSEISITLVDDTAGAALPALPASHPVTSVATATITDPSAITEKVLRTAESIVSLDRAPLVRAAVDALLDECPASDSIGPTLPAPPQSFSTATPEPSPAERPTPGSRLYIVGRDIHSHLSERTAGWHERAASSIVQAARMLADGVERNTIEFNFIRMSLAQALNHFGPRTGSPASTPGDNDRAVPATAEQLDALDRPGRLRDPENADRRKLDAALDIALPGHADPKVRRLAGRIVDLVAEMANEAFRQRLYRDEVEHLVAASDRNDLDAMHKAFIQMYGLDRSFASPYRSDLDRCVALVDSLPPSVQEDFMRTFALSAQVSPTHGLGRYLDTILAGTALPDETSERLRSDLRRFMMDLFAAAERLAGARTGTAPAARTTGARTTATLLDMPPPARPTVRAVALGIWRRIFPGTRLERAKRQVFQAIKRQAASARLLTRSEWQALENAMRELARLQRPPARYADVVQACVGTLTPGECIALHHVVETYPFLKVDDPEGRRIMPAPQKQHLLALDAALTMESATRHAVPVVAQAVEALRGDRRSPRFLDALEALSDCLDKHAADLPDARALCESALRRLALPSRDVHAALERLATLTAQGRLKDDIKAEQINNRKASNPRMETISLMPALRALGAALEHRAA